MEWESGVRFSTLSRSERGSDPSEAMHSFSAPSTWQVSQNSSAWQTAHAEGSGFPDSGRPGHALREWPLIANPGTS